MKKIIITGNLGYVAPALIPQLREQYPAHKIVGLDTGFFEQYTTKQFAYNAQNVDEQIYSDVRDFSHEVFNDCDIVIHLAAISNDPMGEFFSNVTNEINLKASIAVAEKAKLAGVKRFVFASSCSVYGAADTESFVTESSRLNPVTTYAKSKISFEIELQRLSSSDFSVVCLRFATACGASERLRLDLVLNDFVYNALATGVINILSDGTPWRPLIDTQDMSRAMVWASCTELLNDNFFAINAGSSESNYQIKDLAYLVKEHIPTTEVKINPNASPDTRSYRVDFSQFEQLAGDFKPQISIKKSIEQLTESIRSLLAEDENFNFEGYKRLNILHHLIDDNQLDLDLRWR